VALLTPRSICRESSVTNSGPSPGGRGRARAVGVGVTGGHGGGSHPGRRAHAEVGAGVAADEAFLTNAFGAAVPVRGRDGMIVRAVQAMFDELWRVSC